MTTLSDSDAIIVQAFLFALHQHAGPLPPAALQTLQDIAPSLETRVMELQQLAQSMPTLATPYDHAYMTLLNPAARRSKGLDEPPAPEPNPDELLNNIRLLSLDDTKKILQDAAPENAIKKTRPS